MIDRGHLKERNVHSDNCKKFNKTNNNLLLAKILRGFKNNRISALSMFLIHLSCLEIVVIVSLSIL